MRNFKGKQAAALLSGLVLLVSAGWGARWVVRDSAEDRVAHGPFLVPRAVLSSGVALAPLLPSRAVRSSFITHNSSFIIRQPRGSLAFAQRWEGANSALFKADITGAEIITTVAGTGVNGFSGDGGPAASAQLGGVLTVAIDAGGNLFIGDIFNQRIRKVAAGTGIITTVAGTGQTSGTDQFGIPIGGFSGDGGPATSAQLDNPFSAAVDAAGNLFIADFNNNRIRKVAAASGIITTVAGSGSAGTRTGTFSGDGGPATSAGLNGPSFLYVDAGGNLFLTDSGNHRIRRVDAQTGIIATYAGSGPTGGGQGGFAGDGGPATSARLNEPFGFAVDAAGNLFIADRNNNRIRKVAAGTGIITTVAGTGQTSGTDQFGIPIGGFSGDGGPATSAQVNGPTDVAVDASGNIFIADRSNNRIRKVAPATGLITTVAGSGATGFGAGGLGGDGGAATSAQLNAPFGVAFDASGNLFIADGSRIRKVQAVPAPGPSPTRDSTTNFADSKPAVFAGVQNQSVANITIIENFAGAIPTTGFTCTLVPGAPLVIFAANPTAIRTAGNLGTLTVGGVGGVPIINSGAFGVTPAAASSVASTLLITGIRITVSSAAPTGDISCLFAGITARSPLAIATVQPLTRSVITAPANNATQTAGANMTISWSLIPDSRVASYFLEYTGPGRTFANPRGAVPDSVNGFGGAGGGLILGNTTSMTFTVSTAVPSGVYSYRIFGLDSNFRVPTGLTASDAQVVNIIGGVPPGAVPTPTPTPRPTPLPTPTPRPTPLPTPTPVPVPTPTPQPPPTPTPLPAPTPGGGSGGGEGE